MGFLNCDKKKKLAMVHRYHFKNHGHITVYYRKEGIAFVLFKWLMSAFCDVLHH